MNIFLTGLWFCYSSGSICFLRSITKCIKLYFILRVKSNLAEDVSLFNESIVIEKFAPSVNIMGFKQSFHLFLGYLRKDKTFL